MKKTWELFNILERTAAAFLNFEMFLLPKNWHDKKTN